jgi:hypothetical protein
VINEGYDFLVYFEEKYPSFADYGVRNNSGLWLTVPLVTSPFSVYREGMSTHVDRDE